MNLGHNTIKILYEHRPSEVGCLSYDLLNIEENTQSVHPELRPRMLHVWTEAAWLAGKFHVSYKSSQIHSLLAVRLFLRDTFPEQLVGTCGQRAWPAFSRVLSLERRLKSAVCGTEVNTVQHFQQWIQNGSEACRTTPGISQQVKQSLPKCSTSRWASIMWSISAHLYNETFNIITSTCTNYSDV